MRIFVHAYCVMPDHMHFLAGASSEESDLMRFVESYKQETGFAFARRVRRELWQFRYYDRILRHADSPEAVAWVHLAESSAKGIVRDAG